MSTSTPAAGQVSPDGMWRWDGQRWVMTGGMPPPQPPAYAVQAPYYQAAAAVSTRKRSALTIAGGIVAMFGAPLVFVACIVPYVYWNDTSNGTSSSIFDTGYTGGFWFAVEPLTVILAILAATIAVLVVPGKIARAVGGGVLVALGLQTMAMFIGYTFGELAFGHLGPAGPVGAFAGLMIFLGGGLIAGSLFSRVWPKTAGATS